MISAGVGGERIGRRQQHRDGRHRADARQHADQRAEHAAEEGSTAGSERVNATPKPMREVVQQIHASSSFRSSARDEAWARPGSAASDPQMKIATSPIVRTIAAMMTPFSLNSSPARLRDDDQHAARAISPWPQAGSSSQPNTPNSVGDDDDQRPPGQLPIGSPSSVSIVSDSNRTKRRGAASRTPSTERKVAGAHAAAPTSADSVVLVAPHGERDADGHEHQAGPEILLALDLHCEPPSLCREATIVLGTAADVALAID